MEEPVHIDNPDVSVEEVVAQPQPSLLPSSEPVQDTAEAELTPSADDADRGAQPDTPDHDKAENSTVEESNASGDSLDMLIHDGDTEKQEHNAEAQSFDNEQASIHDEAQDGQQSEADDCLTDSELDHTTTDTETPVEDVLSALESTSLDRRHSVRTEALIQAAARAVVSLRQDGNGEEGSQHHEDADESVVTSTTTDDDEDHDETIHLDDHSYVPSRPESSASQPLFSPTEQSSVGDGAESISHHGTDDDVFSDHSPRTSIHSDEHFDDEALEQMTEKGDQSPYARSRVTSGVSMSGASAISDLSRLSRYEKEDFIPTSRSNRPAFRSPSSVRAIQMSSPTPSVYSSSARPAKRPTPFPTISRLGSPSVSGQHSPKGRSTPSRFKRPEAPLVLLHVTLLPLRWVYGEAVNHFEAKKIAPIAFSSEGMKNLRSAWRQLQDRLGDTVLERGILLPHPQNDYEILEERLLEALELPLRRRARILECGHYLGASNEMVINDDIESDSDCASDAEGSEAAVRQVKRHWCKTCKGDIKYEELGSERMFRIKVYASNGLMSPGAWEACWKEMERVDIQVEPIIDSGIQGDLAKLAAAFDQEQQQQLEAEQTQQAEEEQRFHLEVEQRLSLEEERHQLEIQRQQFEEERRRTLEDTERRLEEERRKIEEEQRQRLEEERRQQFEEERQLLDAQRQQFEEQRLELEQQRKLVEEEQRQHLEETRRQELEEEQKLIEEQRQQLEEARQQFEEERRQRLDEEDELRRLQREADEEKQVTAPRSTSRTSYVEDDIVSPLPEATLSTDIDGRRRDSDRMREIYGTHSRASSDGLVSSSSPSIHIHVDSSRQREEEQNSRQLANIPTPRDSSLQTGPMHEARHPDSYIPLPSPPSPSEQAYQRREGRRKSLETASLPELLGETIRVVLQDPKNVAIAVLVVLIAMLAGFTKREERGVEIYKPQQHYQHHQLDARDPVGQVVLNTPSQVVETVYKTVTADPPPQVASVSRDIEVVYQTVTQLPSQETATRIVETVYSTVTQSLINPPAAPGLASELPPTAADPSVALNPSYFDSLDDEDSIILAASVSPLTAPGLDPFFGPAFDSQSETVPNSFSNEQTLKTITSEDTDLEPESQIPDIFTIEDLPGDEESLRPIAVPSKGAEYREMDPLNISPSRIPLFTSTTTTTNILKQVRTTTKTETITETFFVTATPSLAGRESKADLPRYDTPRKGEPGFLLESDGGHEISWETYTETVMATSTITAQLSRMTCAATGLRAFGLETCRNVEGL